MICPDHVADEREETRIPCSCSQRSSLIHSPKHTSSHRRNRDNAATCTEGMSWYYEDNIIGTCYSGEVYIFEEFEPFMTIDTNDALHVYDVILENRGGYHCDVHGTTYIRELVVHGEYAFIIQ